MKVLTMMLLMVSWLAVTAQPGLAAGPTYSLPDGSPVTVDPQTRRATVNRGGTTTQLWDGTHRMQDGSILIINDGVAVVPRAPRPAREPEMPREDPAASWVGAPIGGYSPCERLARSACGKQDQCGQAEACGLARQLLAMEKEERTANENPNRMTYTSGQCQEAWGDNTLFPACTKPQARGPVKR